MGISTYLQEALLKHLYRNTDLSRVATVYVSLHTADPTDAGTGTEVSGGSYARQGVDTGASSEWSAPASGGGGYKTDNSNDITFPTATASWGTVTHFGVWDASTSGNLLHYGALDESKTVGIGDELVIDAGDLDLVFAST